MAQTPKRRALDQPKNRTLVILGVLTPFIILAISGLVAWGATGADVKRLTKDMVQSEQTDDRHNREINQLKIQTRVIQSQQKTQTEDIGEIKKALKDVAKELRIMNRGAY